MSDNFYKLTPDIVIQCIESSGLEPTGQYMVLNSYENRVFDLTLENGEHIITKFYRPGRWSREQIEAEHRFLADLQDNDIPVCSPIPFADQKTLHEKSGIFYAIWPRTGGRSVDELGEEQIGILGRLLARIHNTGDVGKPSPRLVLDATTYAEIPFQFLKSNDFIPGQFLRRYSQAVAEIIAIYDSMVKNVPFHSIHGDCHLGNLLHGKDGWFFLDFDDFLTGPAVQDVWMLLPGRDSHSRIQRYQLLQAYRQFRNFEDSWLELIEPLRALRYIHYAGWIAKRWDDPAFPAAFPHFGTNDYWEEETRNLEDQLRLIHSGEMEQEEELQTEAEQELGNKDFFWDWEN